MTALAVWLLTATASASEAEASEAEATVAQVSIGDEITAAIADGVPLFNSGDHQGCADRYQACAEALLQKRRPASVASLSDHAGTGSAAERVARSGHRSGVAVAPHF